MTAIPGDLTLARRLERAEASTNAAFVDARARLEPSVGATWIDVAGAYAMFDGVGSPLTQTFGVGLFDPFSAPEFDRIEAFFDTFSASTVHEVSTFSAPETVQLLSARGYTPIEQSTVLVRETALQPAAIPSNDTRAGELTTRCIENDEIDQWARVSALGWSSESAELGEFVEKLSHVMAHARGVRCFVAEVDGQAIAAAALCVSGDIALLAGASTVPFARGRGAQQALLHARLAHAAAHGAPHAMIVTQTDSGSQRNAERAGFRPVYARTKWERLTTT